MTPSILSHFPLFCIAGTVQICDPPPLGQRPRSVPMGHLYLGLLQHILENFQRIIDHLFLPCISIQAVLSAYEHQPDHLPQPHPMRITQPQVAQRTPTRRCFPHQKRYIPLFSPPTCTPPLRVSDCFFLPTFESD